MNKFMLPGVDAKVELLFSGYEVTGFAAIRCWDDSDGIIKMKPFFVDSENIHNEYEFEDKLKSLLNDNGFGCKDIIGAYVNIFASYCLPGGVNTFEIWTEDRYVEKLEGQFTDIMKNAANESYHDLY
jgi:hypothetical protein